MKGASINSRGEELPSKRKYLFVTINRTIDLTANQDPEIEISTDTLTSKVFHRSFDTKEFLRKEDL